MLLVLIASCASKKLRRQEAFQTIQQEVQYPKVIDYDLYCSDPQFAKKVIDAGLERQGLVRVQHEQKLADIGKTLIRCTPAAQSYLLSIAPKDKAIDVQKMKIADAVLGEMNGIKTENDGNNAVVEYTTIYKNITPFSALTPINFNLKTTPKAYFIE